MNVSNPQWSFCLRNCILKLPPGLLKLLSLRPQQVNLVIITMMIMIVIPHLYLEDHDLDH